MRRVRRAPLSAAAQEKLCELTWEVAAAGVNAAERRVKARKAKAKSCWESRTDNKAFKEIRETLAAMAPGNGYCMYCEISMASAIDHFWPKERYPGRTFTWDNYLWSCSICNGDFKGTKFPRDEGGAPLLINPADERDDPHRHLEFSPTTGKLIGLSKKGEATVKTLGFDRRGDLDNARLDAWHGVQELIVRYADRHDRGDAVLALGVERLIRRHPFSAALRFLLALPPGHAAVHPECAAALERRPEIRTWADHLLSP